MPGFVIHLAVANEYLRKHKNEIQNEEIFLKGVIAPDLTGDKLKSHYAIDDTANTNLKLYFEEKNIKSDFDKGFFLHLLTDHIFYKKYFPNLTDSVYDDYDRLNKTIIQKYGVEPLEEIKEYAHFIDGEPKILKKDIIFKFIDEVSNWSLEEVKTKIENNEKII